MQDNTLKSKEDVLGQVSKSEVTGDFYITDEIVKNPLFYKGSVVRCFCFGCGESTELIPEGADELAKIANAEVPESWQGYYFKSQQCIICGDGYKKVSLEKV